MEGLYHPSLPILWHVMVTVHLIASPGVRKGFSFALGWWDAAEVKVSSVCTVQHNPLAGFASTLETTFPTIEMKPSSFCSPSWCHSVFRVPPLPYDGAIPPAPFLPQPGQVESSPLSPQRGAESHKKRLLPAKFTSSKARRWWEVVVGGGWVGAPSSLSS